MTRQTITFSSNAPFPNPKYRSISNLSFLPSLPSPISRGEAPFEDRRVYPFPAFLLVDYDLKISEAPELLTAVSAIPSCSTLPMIIFSGSDDPVCVSTSYLAGADHYLCKPTRPERMGVVVRSFYEGAMMPSRTFEVLTRLREYRPGLGPTELTRPSAFVAQ